MRRHWTRLDENVSDARVERQLHEYGCGAACAVMLLADRGIDSDQLMVCVGLHLPSTPQALARRLDEYCGPSHRWAGGSLDIDGFSRGLVDALGLQGSWAAQLIPSGESDGHWVVVDGPGEADTILIRDPAGSSYRMVESEFFELMRFMVVVYEMGV